MDIIAENNVIGIGTIITRTEKVHGNELLSSETNILIDELVIDKQPHPTYEYNLEVGSFTAWPTSGLEFHELS